MIPLSEGSYIPQFAFISIDFLCMAFDSCTNPYYIAGVHRQNSTERDSLLPTIPVQPIGYGDARKIFEQMDGDPIPNENWEGKIPGIEYKIGGSWNESTCNSCTIKLHVNNV